MARAAAFRRGPFPARAEQGPGRRGGATGTDESAPPRQNENCCWLSGVPCRVHAGPESGDSR